MRSYTVDDTFDLRSGMPVFDADGQKVGLVTDVLGFGATHLHADGSGAGSEPLTQASSSTGHFGVDPAQLVAGGARNLRLGFTAIHEVVQGHGVTLTPAASADLHKRANGPLPASMPIDKPVRPTPRWRLPWPLRRSGVTSRADG